MFGKIVRISDNVAEIEITQNSQLVENLMNMHIVFEDDKKKLLGEVENVDETRMKVRFLGEFVENKFINGIMRKPSLTASIRLITKEELDQVIGDNSLSMVLGTSPLYDEYPIRVSINELFSNHMAIFGNTGSGKSCGVARLLQNLFYNDSFHPVKSNFLIFDAYGEYHNAFSSIQSVNPNYHFKFYTTNKAYPDQLLRIPLWLLNTEDMALLLNAETHAQLTIIEKMLKLVGVFTSNDERAIRYKNHLIAKAITSILYNSGSSTSKRNDIFQIVSSCPTEQFNLEVMIQGVGYQRRFKDCFRIDNAGQFAESILIGEYVSSFISSEFDQDETFEKGYFTLDDMEDALNFTLISEGLLQNEKMYNEAITLKVRLHSLAKGDQKEFFHYPNYISLTDYIASLVTSEQGKAQIINFNLEDIDDSLAKTITKIYTRLLFDFTKGLPQRASIPFHIFLEEAHRYVQQDSDKFLIGYNIFERVAKEGRKYGLILNLISQRPVELSETVISQCSNFMIFKMNHPRDIDYIKKMLPNINEEIVEKQKTLQPGICVAFGKAFKIAMIVRMPLPNPMPQSSNCDVATIWNG